MSWCEILNMWCGDIDEEEQQYNACCDGDCKGCEFCVEVQDDQN